MKAVPEKITLNQFGSKSAYQLETKLRGLFEQAVDEDMFTEQFGNQEMYREFRRDFYTNITVEQLFDAELIEYVHQDNCYEVVEIVETAKGSVLVLPSIFRVAELIEMADAAIKSSRKISRKPPVE